MSTAPIGIDALRICDFRFVNINSRGARSRSEQRDLDLIYRAWKTTWTATLNDLDGTTQLSSDDFVRADETVALMCKDDVICLGLVNWLDLSSAYYRDLSTFKAFGTQPLEQLSERGFCKALNLTYYAVLPAWRRHVSNLSLSELFLGLMMKRMLSSPASVFLGVARRDRGMAALCSAFTGECLASATLHGVDVDLMAIYAERLGEFDKAAPAVNELWYGRSSSDTKCPRSTHRGEINA